MADAKAKEPVKKKYELLVGNHFDRDDAGQLKEFTVGDVIELDDTQAEAFKDKVKPFVEKVAKAPEPQKPQGQQGQAQQDPKGDDKK